MLGSGAGGKKPIKEAEKLRAQKAKLERVSSKLTKHKNADEELYKAQADWEKTFDAISDWIALIDLKGRILRTNRSGEDFTGISSAQIVGQSCCKLVHASEEHIPGCPLQKMLHTRQRESAELKVPDTNRWLIVTVDPVIDKEGNLIGAVHITRDITERKKAEEALRKREELHELFFSQSLDGFFFMMLDEPIRWDNTVNKEEVLDYVFAHHRITKVNDAVLQQYGASPKQFIGLTPNDLYAHDIAYGRNVWRDFLDAGRLHLETDERKLDGTPIWIDGDYICLYDSQGRITGHFGVQREITEEKRAREALRESEEHYRMLAETMNDGLGQMDETGTYVYVNNKFGEMLGYSPDEMVGRHWKDFFDEDAQKIINEQLIERKKGVAKPYELINTRKDGQKIFIRISPQAIFDENGKFKGSFAILTDITERKKAEEQIEKLAKFPAENPNPVLRISGRGTVVYANKASANLLKTWDCRVGKSLPKPWHELVMDSLSSGQSQQTEVKCDGRIFSLTFAPVVNANYVNVYGLDITERKKAEEMLLSERDRLISVFKAMEDGVYIVNQQHDIQYVNPVLEEDFGAWHDRKCYQYFNNREEACPWCKNEEVFAGKTVRWEWYSFKNQKTYDLIDTPLKNPDGSISKLEIFRDISERKKTEEKLLEDQAKLKAMVFERLMAEERERQRLAVGLHDSVCQKLVLTKLALESSLNLVSDSNVLASLRITCGAIGETIEQADSLTFELSNPVLRQLGFVIALEKYLTEEIQQKHGIAFELESDEQLSTLPDEIKNCLFRVTRELLTNIVKHAQARKVRVSVRKSQSQIYVRVQDDGVGFKESQAGSKVSQTARFGLFSIREQLEYLGGHLEIESEPGRGTAATVVVPLRDKAIV